MFHETPSHCTQDIYTRNVVCKKFYAIFSELVRFAKPGDYEDVLEPVLASLFWMLLVHNILSVLEDD